MKNELSRDILNPYEEVAEWLTECSRMNINPWEYDLKNEIYPRYKFADQEDGVTRLISSWLGEYFEQITTISTTGSGRKKAIDTETEDSDLMQCIYQILWGRKSKHAYTDANLQVDADVMYSFWSPYRTALKNKGLKNWQSNAYTKDNGSLKELLTNKNLPEYSEINKIFNEFANATHTIGNMTLAPVGFNSGKHNDNWSWALNLVEMEKTYQQTDWEGLGVQNIEEYVRTYNQQFFNLELKYGHVLSDEDIEKLSQIIPQEINKRGQIMTKQLMNKLEIEGVIDSLDYNFSFDI